MRSIPTPSLRSGGPATLNVMRAADALASATATYAVPLQVLITTGSTALTGIAFLLEWTPRLAAFTFAGSLVDRWGAGRVFRASNFVRATVVALAAVVLTALPDVGTATTVVVLAFGAVSGLLAEVSFVAVETSAAEAGRHLGDQAHRLQAAQTGIDQGSVLVGPLLGGVLLLAGPGILLSVIALLAMTAAVATQDTAAPAERHRAPSSLLTGWRTLRVTPELAWLVGGLAASNLASGVLQAAAPISVIGRFHYSTASVGAVWSVAAVASLLSVVASRRAIDRWSVWPVGAVAAAVSTAACTGVALAPSFAAYTSAVAVLMAAEGALTVVLRTLRARLIPRAAFGSTLAVTIILVLLPLPVAGLLVAAVPATGLPHLLLACAVLQGMVLAACFSGLQRHRNSCEPARPQVFAAHCSKPAQPLDAP